MKFVSVFEGEQLTLGPSNPRCRLCLRHQKCCCLCKSKWLVLDYQGWQLISTQPQLTLQANPELNGARYQHVYTTTCGQRKTVCYYIEVKHHSIVSHPSSDQCIFDTVGHPWPQYQWYQLTMNEDHEWVPIPGATEPCLPQLEPGTIYRATSTNYHSQLTSFAVADASTTIDNVDFSDPQLLWTGIEPDGWTINGDIAFKSNRVDTPNDIVLASPFYQVSEDTLITVIIDYTINLNGASASVGLYQPAMVMLVDGTGAVQAQQVLAPNNNQVVVEVVAPSAIKISIRAARPLVTTARPIATIIANVHVSYHIHG